MSNPSLRTIAHTQLLLTHSPKWVANGATVQCGCGLYQHYAYKQLAHHCARSHSASTRHQCFVQTANFSLGHGDFILATGEIEEPGDLC